MNHEHRDPRKPGLSKTCGLEEAEYVERDLIQKRVVIWTPLLPESPSARRQAHQESTSDISTFETFYRKAVTIERYIFAPPEIVVMQLEIGGATGLCYRKSSAERPLMTGQ
jgi:hypothetical protein